MNFKTFYENALIALFCGFLNNSQASEFDDQHFYDAQIVTNTRFTCIGEDYVEIKLLSNHEIAEIQWFKDDSLVCENKLSYLYKSGFVQSSHVVKAKITTNDGEEIYTNSLEIVEEPCCADSEDSTLTKQVILIEDFGFKPDAKHLCELYGASLDLLFSPNLTSRYDTKWIHDTYSVGNELSFWKGNGEIGDCQHVTAANVTSKYDGAQDGTQWGETAKLFNGKNPSENGFEYVPDHTSNGYDYGMMLFVNDKFDSTETVIYKTLFTCKPLGNAMVNVRFFFTTFGSSQAPTKVKLRLTDFNTKAQTESDVCVRYNDGSEKSFWKEVSASTMITTGKNTPAFYIEIISVKDESNITSGNQIVIDDIEYSICNKPCPMIELTSEDSTNYIRIINEKQLKKDPNYDMCYAYHYTLTPENSKSWKKLLTVATTLESSVDLDKEISGVEDGDVVYYRVVSGDCSAVSNEYTFNCN